MDDYRQRQWHFPPGHPRPCHTLLEGQLAFVSGTDADSVLGCCFCRKRRKMKWFVCVRLHQVGRKCVSREMTQRSATGLVMHPLQSAYFHFLSLYYYITSKHHTLSQRVCFHGLWLVLHLFIKEVRQIFKRSSTVLLKTISMQFKMSKWQPLMSIPPALKSVWYAITLGSSKQTLKHN